MPLLDISLIKLVRNESFEKFLYFQSLITFGDCFLKNILRTVTVNLWKSKSPVSRVSELQKLLGLFVNMRSIVLGFYGFLKPVGFFIKILRKYKLQKSFKFVSVISELKSPSNMKFP